KLGLGLAVRPGRGTRHIAVIYGVESHTAFPLLARSVDPLTTPRPLRPEAEQRRSPMPHPFSLGRACGRGLVAARAVALVPALVSPASAGECPADQRKANAREAVPLPGSGVTDTVLAAIDLANEPIKANDRQMRVRRLVVQPGGVVPWHSHNDRPALIYI